MAGFSVDLGLNSYDIIIGTDNIAVLGERLKQMELSRKALVITDENVGPLYGDSVLRMLKAAGFDAGLCAVPPGEDSKSLACAASLYTKAIEDKLDRHSPLIALGGGVVGDLAGFIASTYLRGIPFIQMPTSLLAQVDSSVGGKVAVNHPLGKNLIGSFYQPSLVLINTGFLRTLPERELYTGLAEIIKHGIIADRQFFAALNENYQQILAKDPSVMAAVIERSCQIKAGVVQKDEREASLRMILNFGHTIAHGIETATGFHGYNHGEAVAIGMYGAALLSCSLKLCRQPAVDAVAASLKRFHLPLAAQECNVEQLFQLLTRDKKTIGGRVHWVLLQDIGQVIIADDVPESAVRAALGQITLNRI
ncbi:MAG: 3-dehydroquinate synthase [Veillonellales bacterium]